MSDNMVNHVVKCFDSRHLTAVNHLVRYVQHTLRVVFKLVKVICGTKIPQTPKISIICHVLFPVNILQMWLAAPVWKVSQIDT